MTKPIRIAYADDHTLIRENLADLLSRQTTLSVDIKAANGKQLIKKISESLHPPDIVLLDIEMPLMDGIAVLDELPVHAPDARSIILSFSDSEYQITRAMKAGACAYLTKACSFDELLSAIQSVHLQGIYFSTVMTPEFLRALRRGNKDTLLLSKREEMLVRLICSDLSYDQIAAQMCLSIKTIEACRHTLFKKFEISHRSGLIMKALSMGLVTA